jgi:lactate dehydrogenase-like 2-hydroxyacid dehydrogenase
MSEKVFVSRRIADEAIKLLVSRYECEVWDEQTPPSYEVLMDCARTASGIVSMLSDKIDAHLLQSAGPALKVVSQMAVGYDNIDLAAATERGIAVGHTPGVLTDTTADFAWALLMATARRVVEANIQVRKGVWRPWGPFELCGVDVHHATLGVIGMGRIGQAVARRGRGFEMTVLYHDQNRVPEAEKELHAQYVEMDELLKRSDFISLHVNLTDKTYHLISTAQLAMMKPTAILVNTSRGPVVDPQALAEALKAHKIGGAALDVTEPEPIPADSPLTQMPNVVITPHIASGSYQTRTRMSVISAENLIAGIEGEKLQFCANPEVYQHLKGK